ncbi:MAG: N-methyl-L-tryptophan oxidase [Gemmatimonadaceae bacterium]
MKRHDVIVIGLGLMGSAAARELAGRGLGVLGLDQFSPPHGAGSSHGGSRIIREAYYEGPEYVPLVRRAYELWQQLERDSGTTLLVPTGGLTIGRPDSELVTGALDSVNVHGIAHDLLTSGQVMARFPEFRLSSDMVAVYERRAGVLLPEACVSALLAQALQRGADIRMGERVLNWSATSDSVTVQTANGTATAGSLVLAAGGWLPELAGDADLGLWVERQVMHWFDAAPYGAHSSQSPIPLWQLDSGRMVYSTPDFGEGSKIAFHHDGEAATMVDVDREVRRAEVLEIEETVAACMPGLTPTVRRSATCVYTNTENHDFLIDRHPDHSNVVIASACSGHGFKFGPAVAELVAQLVTHEQERPPARFATRKQ